MPLGPRYWTVRSGQSFGSIAARTGHDIGSLQRLNPRLKATALAARQSRAIATLSAAPPADTPHPTARAAPQ